MPKRKRKNNRHNEIEGLTFIDISTINSAPASTSKSTVPKPQVINIVERNIDGNRVSTSNTLTTSIIETAASTVSDSNANNQPHEYDLADVYSNFIAASGGSDSRSDPQGAKSSPVRYVAIHLVQHR